MKKQSNSVLPPVLGVLVVLGVLSLLLSLAAAAKDIPQLTGRIVDQANLLTADERQRVESKLAQFEQQTGDQVAVLTVDSLDGEAIEDYANKVGRAWALGQKGKDNGVLLLVAKQDRKMRIEVGYGLEPVLTDLQTKVIQDEVIIPYFKKGDFGGGIAAGVDAILSTLQGKPFQAAPEPADQPAARGKGGPDFGFLLFLLFILVPFSLNAARSRSWLLYIVLMPIYFFLGSLISTVVGLVALGVWAVLFPILRMVLPNLPGGGRRGGPGGWFMGPGWGGGGGGGGFFGGGGGGGFSGGGGSFGGGGSSSSW